VSVMSGKRTAMPAADVQRRATKIAMQASKLADQARPITKTAAMSAKRQAGSAAEWAGPRVVTIRTWMAVRAARGSVSVQKSMAPKVAAMLEATARRLDPPKPRSRRMPKILAGAALLAAGCAAAAALAMRNREALMQPPPGSTQPMPASKGTGEQPSTMMNQSAEPERASTKPDVNGLSHTR
jgi:hypothetical protein